MAVIASVSYDSLRQAPELLNFITAALADPKALKEVLTELNKDIVISKELLAKKQEAEAKIKEAVTLSNEIAQEAKELEEHKDKIEKKLTAAQNKLAKDKEDFSKYVATVEEKIVAIDGEHKLKSEQLEREAARIVITQADLDAKFKAIAKEKKDFETTVSKFNAAVETKIKELDEREAAISAREEVFRTVAKQLG